MGNWTAWGLSANILGTVMVGFVSPRYWIPTANGGGVFANPVGRWAWRGGWGLIVLGFVGQLIGSVGFGVAW